MAHPHPFAYTRMGVPKVSGTDLVEGDENVVIRRFCDKIARRGRPVKDDRCEILTMRRPQIADKCVKIAFHNYQSPPAPPPPKSPPPPKPPNPPLSDDPPQSLDEEDDDEESPDSPELMTEPIIHGKALDIPPPGPPPQRLRSPRVGPPFERVIIINKIMKITTPQQN